MTDPLLRGERPQQMEEYPPSHIINFAVQASTFSPCRSKRGAAIFTGDHLISTGYNYKPRAFACDGSAACKATCRAEAIHAEQHALLTALGRQSGAEMLHVKTVNGELVPSGGPSCVQCSKLALVAGVTAMWLYHEDGWKRYDAAEWHRLSLIATRAPASSASGDVPALIGRLKEFQDSIRGPLGIAARCLLRDAMAALARLQDERKYDSPKEWATLFNGALADDPSIQPYERALSFLRIWANSYLLNGVTWDIPQTMGAALLHVIAILENKSKATKAEIARLQDEKEEAERAIHQAQEAMKQQAKPLSAPAD